MQINSVAAARQTHDQYDPLTVQDHEYFEHKVPHLFVENAVAGGRNGFQGGKQTSSTVSSIVRVSSVDSSVAAARQASDQYGQLRRVVHLVRGAPVMLIANLRTSVGLVNGAIGHVVAAVLGKDADAVRDELRNAVPATVVSYVVVDFPRYNGPVLFDGHPTWVPVRPFAQSAQSASAPLSLILRTSRRISQWLKLA